MAKCPNCGQKMTGKINFCGYCGTNLKTGEQALADELEAISKSKSKGVPSTPPPVSRIQQTPSVPQPAQTPPAPPRPVQNSVAPQRPVQNSVVQQKPVQNSVVQQKPVQNSVVQQKPVQNSVVQQKPVQNSVVQQKPVQNSVASQRPVQNSVVQQKPVQNSVVQQRPVQNSVVQQKPVQNSTIKNVNMIPENEAFETGLLEDEIANASPVLTISEVKQELPKPPKASSEALDAINNMNSAFSALNKNTSVKPSVAPSTVKPSIAPSTVQPSVAPSTVQPSVAPSTVKPSIAPSTVKPSIAPSTVQPSVAPSTVKPSVAPSTVKPSVAPSTVKPSVAPSTVKPSVAPSTVKPSVAPSTVKPSVAPSTVKPSVAPSTVKPSVAPSTVKPSVAPSTSDTSAPANSQQRKVRVLSCIGLDLRTAKAMLERTGLKTEVIMKNDEKIDRNKIMAQSVPSGSEVSQDTVITLTVSCGTWSKWTETEPSSEGNEIETRTEYRTRTREKIKDRKTSSSPEEIEGYILYDSKKGFGEWKTDEYFTNISKKSSETCEVVENLIGFKYCGWFYNGTSSTLRSSFGTLEAALYFNNDTTANDWKYREIISYTNVRESVTSWNPASNSEVSMTPAGDNVKSNIHMITYRVEGNDYPLKYGSFEAQWYKYKTRTSSGTTYYFEKEGYSPWSNWSEWSETSAVATEFLEVETRLMYRSRIIADNK